MVVVGTTIFAEKNSSDNFQSALYILDIINSFNLRSILDIGFISLILQRQKLRLEVNSLGQDHTAKKD